MHLKNRSGYFILLQKIRIQIRTARECLTETVGFTLGEIRGVFTQGKGVCSHRPARFSHSSTAVILRKLTGTVLL